MPRKKKTQQEQTKKGALDAEIRSLMTPQAIEELNALTPTIQQFLLRWQDKRDLIILDELQDYLSNNDELHGKIAVKIYDKMVDVLNPIKEMLARHDAAIIELQKQHKQPHDFEIRLTRLEKVMSPRRTFFRIVLTVLVAVALSLSVYLTITNKRVQTNSDGIHRIEQLIEQHMKDTQ